MEGHKADEAAAAPPKCQPATHQIQNIQQQQMVVSFEKSSYERSDIKPTKKRYLILLLFCLHSMINAAQWIYLSSITSLVAKYYQVDNMAINWTSMVYMVVYIPLIVPASWLFERLGLRNAILLGSLGTTLGSLVKCFSCHPSGFYLLMAGQTLVAISQLFVLSVPPRLASVWFPDHQVSLANACGVFGNQLGIALGFVVPQLVIGEPPHHLDHNPIQQPEAEAALTGQGLYRLFVGVALVSALASLLIMLLFDQTPPKPPGLARLQQMKQEEAAAALVDERTRQQHNFGHLLWRLMSDLNFVLLVVSYGLLVGVFYAISTVLNQMLAPNWPNANALSGRLGLAMVVSGMFGSVVSGYILDRWRKFRLVNTGLYLLSLVSMLLFAWSLQARSTWQLYLTIILLGYFMTGYLLIGFEMSNEITWPLPESVSAGLLNLSAQVFGALLTYAGSSIVDNQGNLVANLFFSGSILLGLAVTVTIKAQMKRQNAMGV